MNLILFDEDNYNTSSTTSTEIGDYSFVSQIYDELDLSRYNGTIRNVPILTRRVIDINTDFVNSYLGIDPGSPPIAPRGRSSNTFFPEIDSDEDSDTIITDDEFDTSSIDSSQSTVIFSMIEKPTWKDRFKRRNAISIVSRNVQSFINSIRN